MDTNGAGLLTDYANVNWSDGNPHFVIVLTAGACYSTSRNANCSTGSHLNSLAMVITGHICLLANSTPSGK